MIYPTFSYDPVTEEILPNTGSGRAVEWIKRSPDKWLIVHDTDQKAVRVYQVNKTSSSDPRWSDHPFWVSVKPTPVIEAHYLLFQ